MDVKFTIHHAPTKTEINSEPFCFTREEMNKTLQDMLKGVPAKGHFAFNDNNGVAVLYPEKMIQESIIFITNAE